MLFVENGKKRRKKERNEIWELWDENSIEILVTVL